MTRPNAIIVMLTACLVGLVIFSWPKISSIWAPSTALQSQQLPGLEMVKVDAGKFALTILVPNSLGRKYHSKQVEIKHPFEVSRHEITIDQWNLCFKDGGCARKAKQRPYQKGNHPVTLVSWFEAVNFTKWLSGVTGANYRLPTEEEWTYAAFTGKNVTKKTIENLISERREKRVASMTRIKKTLKVGGNGKNDWAISDTKGSVWEWTLTCWFSSDQANKRVWSIAQLKDKNLCPNRVVQGYERGHVPVFVNEVLTGGCGTGAPIDHIGFRVVKDLNT